MTNMKKTPLTEVNEAAPTAKQLIPTQHTTEPDSHRAAKALLAAIPGMARIDAQGTLNAIEAAYMPHGEGQALYTAMTATVDAFPAHPDRAYTAALIARELSQNGELTPGALDYLMAANTNIPTDRLIIATEIEYLSRQCQEMLNDLIDDEVAA